MRVAFFMPGRAARCFLAACQLSGYYGQMEKTSVSKLKDNLSAYLRKVRAGTEVVIYDRDVPIARLERIESTDRSQGPARAAACAGRDTPAGEARVRPPAAREAATRGRWRRLAGRAARRSQRRALSATSRHNAQTPRMRFWVSSAIVPLIAAEPRSDALLALLDEDAQVLAWWGTTVEIASALARLERDHKLTAGDVASALASLRQLADAWHEIVPSDAIRRTAERVLRAHPLRAADSLQLAAAIVASDHDPATLDMVCLDARLAAAARREGFTVVPP